MNIHETFMLRCIELAKKGAGNVSPNPMVGCVIVNSKGQIIGKGFHEKFGGPHAEVNAIQSVSDKQELITSTLYVNLEPCAHVGKTPPCANLIIASKIPRVVIANKDPHKLVSGKGIELLQQSGIEVISGILEDEAWELNKRFFTFHEKKRPYIILKWAVSGDGLISKNNERTAISHQQTNVLVHQWRSEEQGIVIGKNTAITDNPQLNVRHVKGRNPIRFIFSSDGQLPENLILLNDGNPTHVISDTSDAIQSLLNYCNHHHIISVMVEGGTYTLQKFIDSDYWDEARIIRNNELFLETGTKQPVLKNSIKTGEVQLDRDIIEYFKNNNV